MQIAEEDHSALQYSYLLLLSIAAKCQLSIFPNQCINRTWTCDGDYNGKPDCKEASVDDQAWCKSWYELLFESKYLVHKWLYT